MNENKSEVSQRIIYIWNLLGNLFASGVSVFYLMIVTRLSTALLADYFSLASSIASLWVVIGLFQVRNYQGTDIDETFSLGSYMQVRFLTIGLMWLTLFPYLYLIGRGQYHLEMIVLTVLFLAYRTVDAVSDVFQGYFQQIGRLDIAGKAMTFRYIGSVLLFAVSLLLSFSLYIALIVLIVWNVLFLFVYEIPHLREFYPISWKDVLLSWNWDAVLKIVKTCFPLFINGFLLLYILNEPKIAIESVLQMGVLETGAQRDFNILFMPVFFMSMCVLVIRPFITQMAVLWHQKNNQSFYGALKKLLVMLMIIGLIAVFAAYLIGIPMLSFIFKVDLSSYVMELTVLVASGVLYSLAIAFENILTIFRKHSYLIVTYLVLFTLSVGTTNYFVLRYGLMGACLSFAMIMLIYLLGTLVTYRMVNKWERK